jgi:hypothetical protein
MNTPLNTRLWGNDLKADEGIFGARPPVEGRRELMTSMIAVNHRLALMRAPKLYKTKNTSIVEFSMDVYYFGRDIKRRRYRHRLARRLCKDLTEEYFNDLKKRGLI